MPLTVTNPGDTLGALRPTPSRRTVALVAVLTAGVAACEAPLFYGVGRYALQAYLLFLVALSLAPLVVRGATSLLQAFALLAVFRVVNLTMPVFVDRTLLWFPFVYGPLVPVFVYVGREALRERRADQGGTADDSAPLLGGVGVGLPRWLGGEAGGKLRWLFRSAWNALPEREHRSPVRAAGDRLARAGLVALVALGVVVALLALFLVSVGLAEQEYRIVGPAPLVTSLDAYQVGVLAVVMIGVVGPVEELLFRGVLQRVLERRLGVVPGLLVASAVFGLMHSAYGLPVEIAFAVGVGLLFGVLYDLTDSLLLVGAMHGTINVFLFGIIPLDGGGSVDLLRALALEWLTRLGVGPALESVGLLAAWLL